MFPSYRNQSADLHGKSTDWFLYDGKIDRLEVKIIFPFACSKSTEETPEKCAKRHSRVFIFNFEQISCIVLVTQ